MRARRLIAGLTLAGTAVAGAVVAPSAYASGPTKPLLTGTAAGTEVVALGGIVTSGPTAASGLRTLSGGQTSANAIAAASVKNVLSVGAVTTATTSSLVAGVLQISAHARTAGVNLLNGVVTADAVDTLATAALAGGVPSATISTKFVNLRVAGIPVRANIGPNSKITIPGIATVEINYGTTHLGVGEASSNGAGIIVTLLKSVAHDAIGTTIEVNPVSAAITQVGPAYAPLGGLAFATEITAYVGDTVGVLSGPTGATSMPQTGTGGNDVTNDTAAVNLPPVATIGAVGSTANGIVGGTASRSTMTARVAAVNLLNGLITADAVTATAQMSQVDVSPAVPTASSQLVNLTIGGSVIPIDVAPNTVIPLAGLGYVTINGQSLTASSATAVALDVHLTTAAFGLPAGADVLVGYAQAKFTP